MVEGGGGRENGSKMSSKKRSKMGKRKTLFSKDSCLEPRKMGSCSKSDQNQVGALYLTLFCLTLKAVTAMR